MTVGEVVASGAGGPQVEISMLKDMLMLTVLMAMIGLVVKIVKLIDTKKLKYMADNRLSNLW